MKNIWVMILTCLAFSIASCQQNHKENNEVPPVTKKDTVITPIQKIELPQPFATKSVENYSKVIGWPKGKTPLAPERFTVSLFADSLDNPRWIYVADNGDIFVAEASKENSNFKAIVNPSADKILLFRDTNGDGMPDMKTEFLKGLNKPFGMQIIGNNFYVANTDAVIQFPYMPGSTSINASGKKIITLPSGNKGHWTRNLIANKSKTKLYVSIGSASNVAEGGIEKEEGRACIIEMNTDGTGEKIYANGLRNPIGMAWAPGTNTLWTVVNERDKLGDELVPDYLTSVKENGFYGWPYSYFGQNLDPRMNDRQRPDLVSKAIVPDVSLNSHTAALGLVFYEAKNFPEKYQGGAFIGEHGSWNRSHLTGYVVTFVPFKNGKPSGKPEDFLTGFIANESKSEVYGRPVGVAVLKDGSLLVADDASNRLWRISKK